MEDLQNHEENNWSKKDPHQFTQEFEALLQISYFVDSAMALHDILDKIVEITVHAKEVDVCSIYLKDEAGHGIVLRASRGLSPNLINQARYESGEGIPGWVFANGETLALSDAQEDERFQTEENSSAGEFKSWLCVPLYIREEIIGCLSIRMRERYEFDKSDLLLYETIARQIGIVIEKSRLYFDKIDAERMGAIGLSLSEISHSIKNILSNMQGSMYLVESCLARNDISCAREAWDLVRRSNRKIARLVQNMLSFSRSAKPHLERNNLNALITDILEQIERTLENKNITVEPRLETDLPESWFDYDHIYDAVMNLVTNAADSLADVENGQVEIRTKTDRENKQIILTVRDNGCGIPKELQSKIFQLFFTTKGAQGTGIGLACTRKIIEEHGGKISLESESGEGAAFIVRLPLEKPEHQQTLV
ncbi:GAF domain-containing protein [Candidatus Sumerlaeota bacterium]|nr:GAF domain-containing protein [Candidatus Sumerlaeota bacterium]